jgi:hypothetical protein
MAQGCESYNDCLKEEAKVTKRFRAYTEKICLDLEEVKELGMQLRC